MANQSNQPLGKRSGTSIERKLLIILMVGAVLPITILAATAVTGMFQFEAIVAAAIAQVLGLGIGYQFVSGIVRQSATINETLSSINKGDFEARATTITNDELGEAAVALNAMCDNTLNLIQSNDEQDQIQSSIETLISEMNEIAAGDLTITTTVKDDMTGSIAGSVNQMTEQLRSIVQQVQAAAQQVTTSSTRIREASTLMSNDTDAQALRINEASEQLLEMNGSFQNMAALTKESVQVAIEARQSASNGLRAVSDTVDGMQRIRNQVQSTSKRIKRFGESSQEIGEIVQMISDITDRTSILALNASIQAAMAGDAGQGFAVVAEEIERLADSSKDATKRISKLIRAIQNETSDVISDMEESTREVVAGSQLASQAGETLFEIDHVSNQLVELIQNSSAYALEQAETAAQVAGSMSEISISTKQSAEKSREANRSVGRLADRVSQLRDSVSQFKVAGDLDGSQYLPHPVVESSPIVASETPASLPKPAVENKQRNPFSENKKVKQTKAPSTKRALPITQSTNGQSPRSKTNVSQTLFVDERKLGSSAADVEAEAKSIEDNLLSQAREARAMLEQIRAVDGRELASPQSKQAKATSTGQSSLQVAETMVFDEGSAASVNPKARTVCASIDADMLQKLKAARDLIAETKKSRQGAQGKNPGTVMLDQD